MLEFETWKIAVVVAGAVAFVAIWWGLKKIAKRKLF